MNIKLVKQFQKSTSHSLRNIQGSNMDECGLVQALGQIVGCYIIWMALDQIVGCYIICYII
jgi:hypothetical protein